MTGYANDYSMSNRAKQAYAGGEKPLSKISAQDISGLGLTLKEAKLLAAAGIWKRSSWHHTSSKFNKTNFYDVQDLAGLVDEIGAKALKSQAVEYAEAQTGFDVVGVEGDWSGAGRNKELSVNAFRGVHDGKNTIRVTSYYSQYSGDWKAANYRKKANGNWIDWRAVEGDKCHYGSIRAEDARAAKSEAGLS